MTSFANDALGIVLSTVTDAEPSELIELAVHAEQSGMHSVFVNEGRGDALAHALAIALATKKIRIGTNIANIYFRHPFLTAATARTIAELSTGRLILGLGMSHRGLLKSLDIDMGNARSTLKDYVHYVKRALTGDAAEGFLRPPPAKFAVPVYAAANTIESARVAGQVADGLMPFLSPKSYIPTLMAAAAEVNGGSPLPCILSIPTFVSADIEAARSAARYNLAFFAQLPNYRRQWRRAGYKSVMDAIQEREKSHSRRELSEQIPDELIEQVCIFGTPEQCLGQIEKFRQVGVDLPVIAVSPVNENRHNATERAIGQLTR